MRLLESLTFIHSSPCREGYKFHPNKVLAIYTYSKRANLEELETKSRKTQGYSTVSHFNVVHVDCHNNAVRMQRGRDEWESAALQNANTRYGQWSNVKCINWTINWGIDCLKLRSPI